MTSSAFTIREATLGDLDDWVAMRSLLWPKNKELHRGELLDYFDGSSIDIKQAYLLIKDLREAVGFIELNIREFAEGSRRPKVPYVEAWYINPEFQGHGHGKSLMCVAERWAIDLGFQELASDTDTENHHSIHIHHSLGFKETERVVCFLKKLK